MGRTEANIHAEHLLFPGCEQLFFSFDPVRKTNRVRGPADPTKEMPQIASPEKLAQLKDIELPSAKLTEREAQIEAELMVWNIEKNLEEQRKRCSDPSLKLRWDVMEDLRAGENYPRKEEVLKMVEKQLEEKGLIAKDDSVGGAERTVASSRVFIRPFGRGNVDAEDDDSGDEGTSNRHDYANASRSVDRAAEGLTQKVVPRILIKPEEMQTPLEILTAWEQAKKETSKSDVAPPVDVVLRAGCLHDLAYRKFAGCPANSPRRFTMAQRCSRAPTAATAAAQQQKGNNKGKSKPKKHDVLLLATRPYHRMDLNQVSWQFQRLMTGQGKDQVLPDSAETGKLQDDAVVREQKKTGIVVTYVPAEVTRELFKEDGRKAEFAPNLLIYIHVDAYCPRWGGPITFNVEQDTRRYSLKTGEFVRSTMIELAMRGSSLLVTGEWSRNRATEVFDLPLVSSSPAQGTGAVLSITSIQVSRAANSVLKCMRTNMKEFPHLKELARDHWPNRADFYRGLRDGLQTVCGAISKRESKEDKEWDVGFAFRIKWAQRPVDMSTNENSSTVDLVNPWLWDEHNENKPGGDWTTTKPLALVTDAIARKCGFLPEKKREQCSGSFGRKGSEKPRAKSGKMNTKGNGKYRQESAAWGGN